MQLHAGPQRSVQEHRSVIHSAPVQVDVLGQRGLECPSTSAICVAPKPPSSKMVAAVLRSTWLVSHG